MLTYAWKYLFYLSGFLMNQVLSGISQAYDSADDFGLLDTSLTFAIIWAGCFLIITSIGYKRLLTVLASDIYSEEQQMLRESQQLEQAQEQKLELKVEKKERYFQRISST